MGAAQAGAVRIASKSTVRGWLALTLAVTWLAGCSAPAVSAPVEGGSSTTSTSTTGGDSTGVPGPDDADVDTGPTDPATETSTGASDRGETTDTTGEPSSDDPRYILGFDVATITPTQAHVDGDNLFLGSYGLPFSRLAEGVHDDLNVRSFALELGDDGLLLAVTDLPGMGNRFTRDVRTRVSETTGLPPSRILVATTHTHAAPDFQGLWGGGPSEYREPAIDEVVASLNRAWANRDYGALSVATTTAPNNNRRGWGFTDDELTLLVATNERGETMGTVSVFAAHPTVLGASNLDVSRDWCGYTVDAIEAETGAPALLFNGILGDASPAVPPGDYADDFERAQAYGELIADITLDAMANTEPVAPTMVADHRSWTVYVYNALFDSAATVGIVDYDFEKNGGIKSVQTQSTYVRLGQQLQLVTFPGEPVTRNGLDIKDAMFAPHRMVLGQTGDALGYFIPADEWMMGHNDNYEESISVGSDAGDTARGVLIAMIALDNAGSP